MTLQITSSMEDGIVTLTARGEIDALTAAEFRRALADPPRRNGLVVDLTGVDFMDSAGVKALYDHLDRKPELIVQAAGIVLRVLTITGLHDHLVIRER